jgi:hypothetical protein
MTRVTTEQFSRMEGKALCLLPLCYPSLEPAPQKASPQAM